MCVDMCLLDWIHAEINKVADVRSLMKECATADVNDPEHGCSTLTISKKFIGELHVYIAWIKSYLGIRLMSWSVILWWSINSNLGIIRCIDNHQHILPQF